MNEKQLKSFISAAEYKSFAKAAKDSGVTPPALINQINTLERDAGIEFFDRNTHGIELTAQGEIFYQAAKDILKVYEDALTKCKNISDKKVLNIALMEMNIMDLAPFCNDYQKRHPDTEIVYHSLRGMDLVVALTSDKVQINFCAEPVNVLSEGLRFIKIKEECFDILLNKEHPLAKKDAITIEDLKDYTVYTTDLPMRKVNPVSVLSGYNIDCKCIPEPVDELIILNHISRMDVLMAPYFVKQEAQPYLKRIRTDISGGNIGFVIKENPDALTAQFITEYLSQ